MSADTGNQEKKLKLVRVVLFLPWQDREAWAPCLRNAANKCAAEGYGGHTGKFPPYAMRNNPNARLFGNYEMWRFLEATGKRENNVLFGIEIDIFIDSYVYFCKNMKKPNGQSFNFNELNYNGADSWFDCKYTEDGVLRGIPLPIPASLITCLGNNECHEKYMVAAHVGKEPDHIVIQSWITVLPSGKNLLWWRSVNILNLFDFDTKFSSIPFYTSVSS